MVTPLARRVKHVTIQGTGQKLPAILHDDGHVGQVRTRKDLLQRWCGGNHGGEGLQNTLTASSTLQNLQPKPCISSLPFRTSSSSTTTSPSAPVPIAIKQPRLQQIREIFGLVWSITILTYAKP
jgi:hypothetical protein